MSNITLPYATVDVFTNTPLLGNQLGVVLLDKETSNTLSQAQKHAITREFNYSETVFIHPFDVGASTRRVDIWTPKAEIPFAGHPTIGAVHYIISNLAPEKSSTDNKCVLQLKAGIVVGHLDRSTGNASAEIPHDVHVNSVDFTWDHVLVSQPSLGTAPVTQVMREKQHKAVAIVKGMMFVLVDLSSQADLLAHVQVTSRDIASLPDLDAEWNEGLMGSLFFVRQPDQGDGVVRVEQRVMVIGLEDPATGSASCALSAYLALAEGKPGTLRFELEQGTQMGRKSTIGCEVTLDESGSKVQRIVLLGQVKQTMKGELSF